MRPVQPDLPVQVASGGQRGPLIIAGAVFLAVLAALATAVLLSGQVGDDAPPPLPAFQPPQLQALPRYEVRNADGATAVLVPEQTRGQSSEVTRDLDLATTKIEALRPILPEEIEEGDQITLVGVYNVVFNFSIRMVVVHPGGGGTLDGEFLRSAGGFLGHEPASDPLERPIVSGTVVEIGEPFEVTFRRFPQGEPPVVPYEEQVGARTIQLERQPVPFTLELLDTANVFRLEPADGSVLKPGDRVALNESDGTVAILVLPPPVTGPPGDPGVRLEPEGAAPAP